MAAAAFACSGAEARGESGWHLLREDGRTAYYIERDQPAEGGAGGRIVTLKRDFKDRPQRRAATPGVVELDCMGNPLSPRSAVIMTSSLDTVEFDCRGSLYRFVEIVIYDQDGVVMHRYRPDDRPIPVPPTSYLEAARSRACR